jgi:PAS domain S-box-containing protein
MKDRRQAGAGANSPAPLRASFIAMAVLLGYVVVSTAILHRLGGSHETHEAWEFANYTLALVMLGAAYYGFVIRPAALWKKKEAARVQLAELSAAIENMSDGFFALDSRHCFTFVNKAIAAAFGKAAEELIGHPVWDYMPPEQHDQIRGFYESARQTQKAARFELYERTTQRWTEINVYPDLNGLAIFLQDTTQRHLTEQRLERKTRAQTALAQFSAFAFATEDLPSILKHAGQIARDVLQVDYAVAYEVDTATGDVRVTVDSGDLPTMTLPQKLAEYADGGMLRYAIKTGETVVFSDKDDEARFVVGPILSSQGIRSGIVVAPALHGAVSLFSVFSCATRVFDADEIEFTQALGRMVAVLVERDRTLDRLGLRDRALEAVTQGIIITAIDDTDVSAPIIYANSAFAAMTGYTREELIGKSSYDFSAPGANPVEAAEARQIAQMRGHIRYEIEALRKDGSTFLNSYSASPVPDRDGRLTRYVTVNEDITDARKRDGRLAEMQKMESVGQLTGGIAHEFNNLLTIVRGNAEDLRDELKDMQRRQADMVVQAADRGAALVRQLLAFSRKQEIKPTVVNLNSALQEFEKLLRRALEARVEIDIRPAADIPPVKVDIGQLENALLNIALNARDAMPEGGTVTIETKTAMLDEDYVKANPEVRRGTYVMIAITDSGVGMTSDVATKAFQPFFTTKAVGEGAGLGLSMVYGFVKQNDGHVKIYSEPGLGTVVKLYFPPVADVLGEDVREDAESGRSAGTERVLMVEDDELVRQSVETKLLRLGYDVTSVTAAAEALDVLESDPHFDLLFTDVIMPGAMTGADLARDVARRWPNIRLLMTSGYTEATVLGKVKMPEGVRLLSKPYSNVELADAISAVLRDGAGSKAQVA